MRMNRWICLLPAVVGTVMVGCAPADDLEMVAAAAEVSFERGESPYIEELLCSWLDTEDACQEGGLAATGADGLVMGVYGERQPEWSDDVGVFIGKFQSFQDGSRGRLQGSWVNHTIGEGGYVSGESSGLHSHMDGTVVGEYLPFDDAAASEGSMSWTWVLDEAQQIREIEGVYLAATDRDGGRFLGVYSRINALPSSLD